MSYNSQRVPSFAAYGGVPQDAAYGGIPTDEAYRLAREKKEHEENYSNQLLKYAQNNLPNIAHDISYISNNQNSQDEIFHRVLRKTFAEEGGYENRANRIDAPTNMGIRQDSLDRFKRAHPDISLDYPNNVRELTYPQAMEIARKDYFDKYRISEIHSQPLQETMFDSFFNHSPTAPAFWAQRAINQNTNMNISEDGIFGSETIEAINNLSPQEIINVNNAIIDQRYNDYERQLRDNSNPNYVNYSHGLPRRFERFRIQ